VQVQQFIYDHISGMPKYAMAWLPQKLLDISTA